MKSLKIQMTILFMAFMCFTIISCGNSNSSSSDNKEVTLKQGKEYTSAYVCPMHCDDSGSDKAGKCPVCGMDYVVNEDHKSDGHDHDDHDGHNH